MAITANLTVIKEYGGTTHWPNGSLLPVDLTCTADGIERPVQISVVLIKQLVSSPFFQELAAYETGAIAVTKLTNCTGQVAYVKESRYDVDYLQNPCCTAMGLMVDAGINKTIQLPANSSSLTATVIPSGGIASILWEQVSGPSTATIGTANQLTTAITGLTTEGDYIFKITVTDNDGKTAQDTVKITVQAEAVEIIAYWGWWATDPFADLHTADSLTWQGSATITHNANVIADYRTAPQDYFLGMKIPHGESVKTTWYNTALNNGAIPDQVFQSMFTANGFDYYISRVETTFDPSATTTFS